MNDDGEDLIGQVFLCTAGYNVYVYARIRSGGMPCVIVKWDYHGSKPEIISVKGVRGWIRDKEWERV